MVDSLTARYSEYPEISEISFLVAKIVHCYFFSMIDWDDFSNLDCKCWNMDSCWNIV